MLNAINTPLMLTGLQVWKLQMSVGRKLAVSGVFFLGVGLVEPLRNQRSFTYWR